MLGEEIDWLGGGAPCARQSSMALGRARMERVMGIEPTLVAWEATVLPLNYTRADEEPRRRGTHPRRDGTSPSVTGQSRTREHAHPEGPGDYIDGSAFEAAVGRELVERERRDDGIRP